MIHYGQADGVTYRSLLAAADIVVSAARQEFFGISVTEAVYAGAFPLLPDRLVYPDRIPDEFHDACLYEDHDGLVTKLTWAVNHRDRIAAIAAALKPVMASYDWSRIAPTLDAHLEQLVHPR